MMQSNDVKPGDRVRLSAVPDWLIHDLPDSEKPEILACIGKTAVIEQIDQHGYFWIGFGEMTEDDTGAHYTGHSFCVPQDCLEPG